MIPVGTIVDLVRRIEAAEPGWSAVDVAAFLRRGALAGGHPAWTEPEAALVARVLRGEATVVDERGTSLAFERVIAGILAALSPEERATPRRAALDHMPTLPLPIEVPDAPARSDRVYAATIVPDLARWQARKLLARAAVPKFDELYAPEHEPRRASDIDAFRLARFLTKDREGRKIAGRMKRPGIGHLSSLLASYYGSGAEGPNARNRFRALAAEREWVKELAGAVRMGALDESWRRAKNKLDAGDELRGFAWSARAAELESGVLARVHEDASDSAARSFRSYVLEKAKDERD